MIEGNTCLEGAINPCPEETNEDLNIESQIFGSQWTSMSRSRNLKVKAGTLSNAFM